MQSEITVSGILGHLQLFLASMAAKTAEILHLEPSRAHRGETPSQAQDRVRQQAALIAEELIAEEPALTRQLQAALVDGQRPALLPHNGLQQLYGIRSKRQAEFGFPPLPGRKLKSQTAPEPIPEPVPIAG
jgi:hypothetical protein